MTLDKYQALADSMALYASRHGLPETIIVTAIITHALRYSGYERERVVRDTIKVCVPMEGESAVTYRTELGPEKSLTIENLNDILVFTL